MFFGKTQSIEYLHYCTTVPTILPCYYRRAYVRADHSCEDLLAEKNILGEIFEEEDKKYLAWLFREAHQLINIAMAIVLECKPGITVELAQPPGLVMPPDRTF